MIPVSNEIPRLLIIEDDMYMLALLGHSLRQESAVITFDNGMDALNFLCERNPIDLVITDLNTPVVNGLQLIKKIKSNVLLSKIPVIIMSGNDTCENRIKCLEAGADDFIVKPFDPRELLMRVKILIKRAKETELAH